MKPESNIILNEKIKKHYPHIELSMLTSVQLKNFKKIFEIKAKQKAYKKAYYQRPEIKAKRRAYYLKKKMEAKK